MFDREPCGCECVAVLGIGEEGCFVVLRELLQAVGGCDEVGEVHDRKAPFEPRDRHAGDLQIGLVDGE